MWTKRNTLLRPLKNVASGTFWIDQSITYLSTLPHVEEKRGLLQKALDLGKVLVWLCLCVCGVGNVIACVDVQFLHNICLC